jgi:hypothetical protein
VIGSNDGRRCGGGGVTGGRKKGHVVYRGSGHILTHAPVLFPNLKFKC